MKHLQKPLPGTPVSQLAPIIRDLVDNVNQLSQIRAGNGIKVDISHGGVLISYTGLPVVGGISTTTPETTGEVILEMHPEWVAARKYRLNERVIHVPTSGSVGGHYSVYQCADASAASGDVPGVSNKWQCLTSPASAWTSGHTYTTGSSAMYGSPGQYKVYTANAPTSENDVPGVSSKWTFHHDVLLGLKSWPLNGTIKVPYRKYWVADVRYDDSTYLFTFVYGASTMDKNGKMIGETIDSDYVTWAQAEDCSS